MAKNIELGSRLLECASLVRENTALADIGTDHAYLPISLVLSGKIKSAIAADIAKGPLNSAIENVRAYGLEDKIYCRISDGITQIKESEADDIVIAGMGAALMIRMIEETDWLRNKSKRLILQPMSKAYDLRHYLYENKFDIIEERAVLENSKIYSVFAAVYTGKKVQFNSMDVYMGKIIPGIKESALYAEKIMRRLKKEAGGLKIQGKTEESDKKKSLISEIEIKYL